MQLAIHSVTPNEVSLDLKWRFPNRSFEGMSAQRKAEHLAVHGALNALGLQNSWVTHSPQGKPMLHPDASMHVSISHTTTEDGTVHAAVAVAHHTIGVDLEGCRPQLMRVAPRVFSKSELDALSNITDQTELEIMRAVLWGVKEAAWKALGPDLAFHAEIELLEFPSMPQLLAGIDRAVRVRDKVLPFRLQLTEDSLALVAGPLKSE
jgi:phosphopantetheinyl transferase